MTTDPTKPYIGFALLFIAAGLGIMIFMPLHPEGLNAPLWVAEVAAASFAFAGLAMLGQIRGWTWVQKFAALAVVYCLATPGIWIALGAESGSCSASLGFFSYEAGNMSCRIVFGFGGLIVLLFAVVMTISFLRKSSDDKN